MGIKSDKKFDSLYKVILRLKDLDEARDFFRDLCTVSELSDLCDRWEIVQMIEKGVPYRAIAEKLGTSTATVSRVAFWLVNGTGGYRTMLDRLGINSGKHPNNSVSFGKGLRLNS